MSLLYAVGYLLGAFANKLTTVSTGTSSSSFVVTSAAALELGMYSVGLYVLYSIYVARK